MILAPCSQVVNGARGCSIAEAQLGTQPRIRTPSHSVACTSWHSRRTIDPRVSYAMLELSDATTPAEAGSFACYHTSRASGVVCADDHRAPDHAGAHARRLGSSRTAHAASAARTAAAPAARARQHAPGWNAGSRAPAADADSSLLLWRLSYLPPPTSRDAHNPARLPDLHPRQIPLCSWPSGPGVAGEQRQVAAGSLSSGLQHLLALLGARQAWVADAASLLERLPAPGLSQQPALAQRGTAGSPCG